MIFHSGTRLPLRPGFSLWVLALLTILTFTARLPVNAAEEFRGIWVDAWGTGFLNASQTTQLIADARAYNYNAIVVQMRRRGDALYAPLAGNDPKSSAVSASYDALADLIAKAHSGSPRIEVHCWVTTQLIWSSLSAPSQAGHVFNTHPEYLMKDYDGTNYIGEGYYLDPGHPDAARWNYTMATNIVRKYDIDGFHWDYIRYPSQAAGYNDTAIARYNAEFGLTGKPGYTGAQFSTWRRRQVTDFLRWANAEMLGIKPNLVVSAAVFGSRSDAYNARFQDWAAWNREGVLDLCLPMIYSDVNSTFTTRVDDAYNNQGVRRVYPGPGAYLNTKENTVWQLNYVRSKPMLGSSLYSYRVPNSGTVDRAGTLAYIRDNFQPSWVSTPALPWKASPSAGLVKGYVKRSDTGAVVYNATVNLFSSPQKSLLSEVHGHFAFFEAPLGTFMLAASAPGLGSVTNMVTVTAGGVVHQDLVLPAVDNTPPIITSVASSNVTSSLATILWNTDEQANTAVDFGLTAAYGNVVSNASLTMAHSITLSNLNPVSTYHYRVRSRNSAGLTTASSDHTFTTLAQGAYNDVIVESRLPDGSVTGNPPYQESAGWGNSTAKSSAAGLSGTGSRYIGTGTPSFTVKPTLPVAGASYDVYMTHHGVAGSISKDIVVSVGQVGCTGLPSTTTIFQDGGGNTWEYLGRMALNPGVSVPQLTFTYSSGTLASSGGRMYADGAKFVYIPPPPAPEIVSHPTDIAVKQGSNATFTVLVANNPAPLSYSWRFKGSVIGTGTNSYTVQDAEPADEGEYIVVVSNSSGSVTSTPAMLTVYTPPSIGSQPASLAVAAGEEAQFEVTAGGTEPFNFQWFFESSVIQGATGPIYTIPSAVNTNAGRYSVIVSNIVGSITSSFANLTITYPAAPEVQSARLLSGNVIELEGTGGPGLLMLEASADMVSWTNRAPISATGNSFLFQEPVTNSGSLFYRLKRE